MPILTRSRTLKQRLQKEEREAPVTELYWPVLKEILENGEEKFDCLDLTCEICFEKMTTCTKDRARKTAKEPHHHGASIAPCGHIFGLRCWNHHFEQQRNRGLQPSCPICRAGFKYPECMHYEPPLDFPETYEELSKYTEVVGKGGKVADRCCHCAVEDALMKVRAHVSKEVDMARLVHPSYSVYLQIVARSDGRSRYLNREWPEPTIRQHTTKWEVDVTRELGLEDLTNPLAESLEQHYAETWNKYRIPELEIRVFAFWYIPEEKLMDVEDT